MEKIQGLRVTVLIASGWMLMSCASSTLERNDGQVFDSEEFEKMVTIKPIQEPARPEAVAAEPSAPTKPPEAPLKPIAVTKAPLKEPRTTKPKGSARTNGQDVPAPMIRQPPEELSDGFNGRRPVIDPYWPGEQVDLDLTYLNIKAGTLTLATRPYVELNGRRAYHFFAGIRSSSMFNMIYSVDNTANSYVDFDKLIPLSHEIEMKETKQLVSSRSYFDWVKGKAMFWETRYTKERGERKRKVEWDLIPFSQNIITAMFYIRVFRMVPGRDIVFRITDGGKNILFRGKVLTQEQIDTALGPKATVKVKGEVEVDGIFKSVGDVFYWFTDDDRRHLVKLQMKIRIGSFVGKIAALEPGSPPQ
jgi:hypothetical protein